MGDDIPDAFADPSDWIAELREQYPEWKPLDPYDPVAMREACDDWWESYVEISDEQDQRAFTLSNDLKRFLILTETVARSAEANGLDSGALIVFLEAAKDFYYKLEDRLPIAGTEICVLVDRLRFKLDAQQHASRPQAAPSQAIPQPPPVPPPALDQDHSERTNYPQIDESQFLIYWNGKSCVFTNGKPFQVLVFLASKFDRWVSMQDIMDEVWAESRTHENTVQAAISKIRRVLRDSEITDLEIDGKTNPGHYKLHGP